MSRSNYSDDLDSWDLIKWRGQVASAIRGKRGQQLLLDLVAGLDALPEKVLIAEDLVDREGDVCALGAVGKFRGMTMENLDPKAPTQLAEAFGVAHQLAAEIAYINDEAGSYNETPQQRWQRVRDWAVKRLGPIPIEEA